MPADSPQWGQCVAVLNAELRDPAHAEIAGTLARQTQNAPLRAKLLIRQAELTPDPAAAADLVWEIHQSGSLPEGRFPWACSRWTQAERGDRVIQAAEEWLRSGKALPSPVAKALADAYRAADRARDARRVATRDPEPAGGSNLPASGTDPRGRFPRGFF